MTVSRSLITASRIMAVLSSLGAALMPLVVALAFAFPDQTKALDLHLSYGVAVSSSVPALYRMLALPFALVPAGIAAWGLLALARLFRLCAQGKIFAPENLRALSQVGTALFWNVVTAFVAQAPVAFFLSYPNGPGHREISPGFGSGDVEVLFLAGATFVIARVMAEARRMADENAAFV